MKFTKETKELIQYISASFMILFGCGMTIASFVVNKHVDNGTLFVLGQSLTFAGAVYGISLHYNNELKTFKTEVRKELHEDKNK